MDASLSATDYVGAQLHSPLTTAKPVNYPDFSGDNPAPDSPLHPEVQEKVPFSLEASAVRRCETARQDLQDKEDKL